MASDRELVVSIHESIRDLQDRVYAARHRLPGTNGLTPRVGAAFLELLIRFSFDSALEVLYNAEVAAIALGWAYDVSLHAAPMASQRFRAAQEKAASVPATDSSGNRDGVSSPVPSGPGPDPVE